MLLVASGIGGRVLEAELAVPLRDEPAHRLRVVVHDDGASAAQLEHVPQQPERVEPVVVVHQAPQRRVARPGVVHLVQRLVVLLLQAPQLGCGLLVGGVEGRGLVVGGAALLISLVNRVLMHGELLVKCLFYFG